MKWDRLLCPISHKLLYGEATSLGLGFSSHGIGRMLAPPARRAETGAVMALSVVGGIVTTRRAKDCDGGKFGQPCSARPEGCAIVALGSGSLVRTLISPTLSFQHLSRCDLSPCVRPNPQVGADVRLPDDRLDPEGRNFLATEAPVVRKRLRVPADFRFRSVESASLPGAQSYQARGGSDMWSAPLGALRTSIGWSPGSGPKCGRNIVVRKTSSRPGFRQASVPQVRHEEAGLGGPRTSRLGFPANMRAPWDFGALSGDRPIDQMLQR